MKCHVAHGTEVSHALPLEVPLISKRRVKCDFVRFASGLFWQRNPNLAPPPSAPSTLVTPSSDSSASVTVGQREGKQTSQCEGRRKADLLGAAECDATFFVEALCFWQKILKPCPPPRPLPRLSPPLSLVTTRVWPQSEQE